MTVRPAAPQILSRADAETFVAGILAIMSELEALLARETAHLRVGRVREGLSEEVHKSELTGAYLRGLETVKANAVALARFAPEAVERLKREHGRFGAAVETNQAVVATARAVSESLVKSISDELHRGTRPQTYGPQSSGHARAPRNEPLIVSRTL